MDFETCFKENKTLLMEGALGERLKREYHFAFDEEVALASLVYTREGRAALLELWRGYRGIAEKYRLPFIATTPTRRANKERVANSRYGSDIIKDNAELLKKVQKEASVPMFIGGLMGCRGDAYTGEGALEKEEAESFHSWQAQLFKEAEVDFLFAGIMPTLLEAMGMAKAMEETGLPYIISFMIRRDGRLIDGTSINDAIIKMDQSVKKKPLCYMTNCVHPKILGEALKLNQTKTVRERFCGIQANTSNLPPEELDGSQELRCSGAKELAEEIEKLKKIMSVKIAGGCCGTDFTHMEEIARRLAEEN